jgi:hypothetical protein
VPKTAGTSIESALLNYFGITRSNISDFEKNNYNLYYKFQTNDKSNPRIDAQHKFIKHFTDVDISNFFTFSFVRNPWDRFLSEYFFIKKNNGCGCKNFNFSEKFPTFKKYVLKSGKSCSWYPHELNQLDFLSDDSGDINVDYIGKFENLQEDFNTICKKIGLPNQQLPHTNKSKHKHYTEYYDDETREIVAEKYAKDIEYFGYKFGE